MNLYSAMMVTRAKALVLMEYFHFHIEILWLCSILNLESGILDLEILNASATASLISLIRSKGSHPLKKIYFMKKFHKTVTPPAPLGDL